MLSSWFFNHKTCWFQITEAYCCSVLEARTRDFRNWQGDPPSRDSVGCLPLPCIFYFWCCSLVLCSFVSFGSCLHCYHLHFQSYITSFPSLCLLFVSFKMTLATWFRAHRINQGILCSRSLTQWHLQRYLLFQTRELSLVGSRDEDISLFGSHHSIHHHGIIKIQWMDRDKISRTFPCRE